jgi:hypothetical protein
VTAIVELVVILADRVIVAVVVNIWIKMIRHGTILGYIVGLIVIYSC